MIKLQMNKNKKSKTMLNKTSNLNNLFVFYVKTPEFPSFIFSTVLKSIIATASLIIPSPKSTAFKTGNLSGLINDMAATVSVAQRTLLNKRISLIDNLSKNK